MTMQGMDVQGIRQLGATMRRNAELLDRLNQEISQSLGSVDWRGSDAGEFRQLWSGQLTHQVRAAAQALHSANQELALQATQQEETSDQLGSTRGGGMAGTGKGLDPFSRAQLSTSGALDWFGHATSGALDWTGDRIKDGTDSAEKVFDAFGNYVSAVGAGAGRVLKADTDAFKGLLVEPLLTGRMPQSSEILARLGLIGGTSAGLLANIATGQDQHFFDDGKPYAGTPRVTEQSGPGPKDFSGLTQTTMSAYAKPGDDPSVTVTVIRNPGERPRYIVSIPGTEPSLNSAEGWTGSKWGNDWPGNLFAMANGTSSFSQATMQAVDNAIALDQASHPGESGKPTVLLSGHSQGGLTSANLAANPEFTSRYDVAAVVSYAAPVESAEIPGSIPVLSLENRNDLVPQLDIEGARPQLIIGQSPETPKWNVTKVDLPEIGPVQNVLDNHLSNGYQQNVDNLPPAAQQQITDWSKKHSLDQFYTGDGGQATTIKIPVGRTR